MVYSPAVTPPQKKKSHQLLDATHVPSISMDLSILANSTSEIMQKVVFVSGLFN